MSATYPSPTTTGVRAKNICLALGVEPIPRHIEYVHARFQRMVKRHVLTKTQPGMFTLALKRT